MEKRRIFLRTANKWVGRWSVLDYLGTLVHVLNVHRQFPSGSRAEQSHHASSPLFFANSTTFDHSCLQFQIGLPEDVVHIIKLCLLKIFIKNRILSSFYSGLETIFNHVVIWLLGYMQKIQCGSLYWIIDTSQLTFASKLCSENTDPWLM